MPAALEDLARTPALALAAVVWLSGAAQAQPGYGPLIDAFCTAEGRIPATPFADGKSSTPLTECQLCHQPNTFNSKQVVEPNFSQFKLARTAGDYSYFCPTLAQTNQAPVLAPVGNRAGSVGVPVSIRLSAADPDGDTLAFAFAVAGAPPGMAFTDHGDGTAEFSWLPGPDQAGNHALTFTVTDSGTPMASDSEQITLSIGGGNQPPMLMPIGNQAYTPGMTLAIELGASDPDAGDRLAFSVAGALAGALLEDRGDGSARWTWTPDAGATSSYELVFSVTDDAAPPARASETVVLSPAGSNRPPVLAPIGDRRARVGEPLRLGVTASDPDGDRLAFSAQGLPPGASFADLGGGAAELRWTPAGDQLGSFPLVVAVADAGVPAEVDSEAFAIAVEPAPVPASTELRVDRARWRAKSRRLFVAGSGAAPREVVSILEAGSGALLGVGRARRDGRFRFALEPFMAPCSVSARVLAVDSAARRVDGAPADCGEVTFTRVQALEWECEHAELGVTLRGAPASGMLEVRDGASGSLLGSLVADHRGRLERSLGLDAAPLQVQLAVRSGDASWELGVFDVEAAQDVCAPELDDEDEHEHLGESEEEEHEAEHEEERERRPR